MLVIFDKYFALIIIIIIIIIFSFVYMTVNVPELAKKAISQYSFFIKKIFVSLFWCPFSSIRTFAI